MASPLSALRKYQFYILALFVFIGMFVFVIGEPLDTWLRSRSGRARADNQVVVRWQGGEFRENELSYARSVRNVIGEFLRNLQVETQKKNGQPRVRALSLSPSEEDVVYTQLFAQRAEEMGMVVSDEAALIYLEQLTANLIPRSAIGQIFRDTVGGRITEQQLLNELKTALLAENYLSLTYPDLSSSQLPAKAWDYHLRLNRRIQAEVLPVQVADFKSKVTKQPTDAEVAALYAEGKDRYPDPASPLPGFKRPRRIAFQFVRADRKKLEDAETAKLKPTITEQEIQEYYDKNKELYRVRDEVPATPTPPSSPPESKPAETENPPATPSTDNATKKPASADGAKTSDAAEKEATPKKDAETKDSEASKSEPKESATKDSESKEAESKEAESKEAESKEAAAKEAPAQSETKEVDQPKDPSPDGGSDSSPEKAATEAQPEAGDDKPADSTESSCGAQEEGDAKTKPKSEEPKSDAAAEKKEGDQPAPASSEKAADADTSDRAPAANKAPMTETKDEPQKPESAAAPATTPPATTPPAATPPATTPPAAAEPKYKPLDDTLKEEIRESLARQKALQVVQQQVQKGFDEIRRAMERYSRDKRSAELNDRPAPAAPDIEKLAAEHQMTVGSIPLSGPQEIQETELGKTRGFDFSSMSFDPIPFHVLAYRDGIPLYAPDQIRGSTADGNPDSEFLYWKTKEEEPFVPELKTVREEVVDAWKMRAAIPLAEAEAQRLAEEARKSGKSLQDTFAGNEALKPQETSPFSWMTRGFLPANMGGMPSISPVDNVEMAGEDFMRAVFALHTGEVGTAPNQPKTTIYVVRVESEFPSEEVLREQFLQSGNSEDLQQIARFDRVELQQDWFEALRRDMNLTWVRDPQS